MHFCYVWIRNLTGKDTPAFTPSTTRKVDELTGNVTMKGASTTSQKACLLSFGKWRGR
jgi:hypothetical protein